MREIKFRGLNKETGEFVYGFYTKLFEGIRRFNAIIADIDGDLTRFYIHHEETIGQFTGLIDAHGKEIYEGDIVSWPTNDYPPEVVTWVQKECAFCAEKKDGSPGSWLDSSCEVVGNIHQNKEVLG